MKFLLVVPTATFATLFIAACGSDDGGESGSSGTTAAATTEAAGEVVNVTLQEYSIIPEVDTVEAGEITFNVENIGPDDVHEFMIVRTQLAPDALPILDDGTVDEGAEGVDLINETEDLAVGESASLSADLDPGAYALICNIYEAAENEAHYGVGMYTGFMVE
jgi:uncharacterized cupredoxin-like copper-binding protein